MWLLSEFGKIGHFDFDCIWKLCSTQTPLPIGGDTELTLVGRGGLSPPQAIAQQDSSLPGLWRGCHGENLYNTSEYKWIQASERTGSHGALVLLLTQNLVFFL